MLLRYNQLLTAISVLAMISWLLLWWFRMLYFATKLRLIGATWEKQKISQAGRVIACRSGHSEQIFRMAAAQAGWQSAGRRHEQVSVDWSGFFWCKVNGFILVRAVTTVFNFPIFNRTTVWAGYLAIWKKKRKEKETQMIPFFLLRKVKLAANFPVSTTS